MTPTSTEAAGETTGVTIGGRYRVIGSLGRGSMGCVYAAIEDGFQRRVAVKVIKPGAIDDKLRARFHVEALATSQLAHPNVVAVHDFGGDDDGLFLVLEHLSGRNVQDALDRDGPMSWRRAVGILVQITAAVAAAHDAGIIHRDLKPKNVFLCEGAGITDFVKVLDFGIAKIIGDRAAGVSTTTGVVLGTPGYVAPECVKNAKEPCPDDPQSDLYALGCIAWALLTSRGPFTAKNGVLLLLRHLSERPPRVAQFADVPPALDDLVTSLLAKEPSQRPSARALLASLSALRT